MSFLHLSKSNMKWTENVMLKKSMEFHKKKRFPLKP